MPPHPDLRSRLAGQLELHGESSTLVSPSDLDNASRLLDFVELYLADELAGRPRALERYLPRFPGHEDEIGAEFERLEQSSGTRPPVPS